MQKSESIEEVVYHKYEHLNKLQHKIVTHIALTIIPPGGIIKLSALETKVVRFVDYFLGYFPPISRFLLGIFFYIFEFSPFLFIFKLKKFTNLSNEDKTKYLTKWESNRLYWIRMGFTLLKTMVSFGYCSNEEVRKQIGIFAVCENNSQKND